MLDDAVERLIRAGGDLVAMPCNTLQTELGSICKERGIEQLDMLDATVEAIVDSGVQRVMVLGTTTTCRADLLWPALASPWRHLPLPRRAPAGACRGPHSQRA